jgi:hypothetical protein
LASEEVAAVDLSIFAGASPWQQWGNTQNISVPPDLFTNPNVHEQQITLVRVQYNRPETWRFLFSARVLSGPGGPNHQSNVSVWFELITGIGRSAIRLPFWATLPEFAWNDAPGPFPTIIHHTSHAQDSNPIFSFTNEDPQVLTQTQQFADLVVGQDMTVVAHCSFTTNLVTEQPAIVEVSGQFAPNVHVRPDWFQLDGHPGEQFAGGEVKGR